MNQNVKVTYNLSAAGQKAALIAGRNASQTVTETMTLEDAALLDKVTIGADGSLSLDASKSFWRGQTYTALALDVPPLTLAEVLAAQVAYIAAIDAKLDAERIVREAKEAEEKRARDLKLAHDGPIVDSILAEVEALDVFAPLPAGFACYGGMIRDGHELSLNAEQSKRRDAISAARLKALTDAEKAEADAKAARIAAMVAKNGGYLWGLAGNKMCSFLGFELWSGGQTKRWVGIFTTVKGISSFLDSPRGEFVFDVSGLAVGDCIQGGGYDTNSRGKRRNESEWFGVVVRNDSNALVVKICNSRAATFAAAKKLEAAAK